MKKYEDIVESLAEEIIEMTEYRDDLEANLATFISSLEQQIMGKVQEFASNRFCPHCSTKLETMMDDSDGMNLEEITACPDCH